MTMSAPPPPRRRIRRWWVVVAMATVLLVALWLLRGPLLAPWVKGRLAETLSAALGGPVSVGAVSGGWLHDATVEGVVSPSPLPGTLRHLSLDRLTIRHRLSLLRGDPTGLQSISASGVRVDLVVDPDPAGEPGAPWLPVLEWLPEPLPAVEVSGGMSLVAAGERLEIPDVSLRGGGRRLAIATRGLTVHGWSPGELALNLERSARDTLTLASPVTVDGVTIERFDLRMGREMQSATATLAAWGGRLEATADPATVEMALSGLDLAALPARFGALLGDFWMPMTGTAEATVKARRDAAAPGGWAVTADLALADASFGGRTVEALHGTAALTADGLRISNLVIDIENGVHADVEALELVRINDAWLPRRGRVTVVVDDLRPWLESFGAPAEWVPSHALALTAIVALDAGTVTVERVRVVGPGLTIDGAGTASVLFRRIGASDLVVHADLGQLAAEIPALAGASGILDGRIRYTGRLPRSLAELLAGEATFSIDGRDLAWDDLTVPRLEVDASSDRGGIAFARVAASAGRDGKVECAGRLGPGAGPEWEGSLQSLLATWHDVGLRSSAATPVRIGPSGWSLGPLQATLAGGTVNLSVAKAEGLELSLAVDEVDLSAFAAASGRDFAGRLSGSATVSGAPQRPDIRLRAHGTGLRLAGEMATLDLAMEQDASGIHVRRCVVDLGDRLTAQGAGSWPATVGRGGVTRVGTNPPDLTFRAHAGDLAAFLPLVLAGGSADLVLGSADGVTMTGALALREVRLRHVDPRLPGRRLTAPLPVDADLRLSLSAAEAALDLSAALAGRTVISGTVSSPGGGAPLMLPGRRLAGQLTVDSLPVEALAGAIPGLLLGSGRLSGSGTLGGTVAAPEFTGELALAGGEFKVTSDVPTITGVEGTVLVRGRHVELPEPAGLTAQLGFAPARLTGGIELGGPEGTTFKLHLTGDNLLLTQTRDLRLRADTDLHLEGPLRALAIRGEVIITKALYSRRVDLIGGKGGGAHSDSQVQLFALREPPLSDLSFDVRVRTLPRGDGLRIANNLVRATTSVDLHLGGTGALPQPAGSVIMREALVTLPFSNLIVERAEVVFPHGDPFAPTISATARAQVRQYAVSVDVQGPLREPDVHAVSPGMDERDALLLLTAGATTAELEDPDGQRAALGRVGTWLGRETLRMISGPGDPDAKPTPLDFLTIEIGREVSEGGHDTIQAEFLLTPLDDPPGIYLAGERDRYDDYNMGFIVRWRWGGNR